MFRFPNLQRLVTRVAVRPFVEAARGRRFTYRFTYRSTYRFTQRAHRLRKT